MNSTTTDIWGTQATVGTVASTGSWSSPADASLASHQFAATKPMPSTYEVTIRNGFHRRPSEGST